MALASPRTSHVLALSRLFSFSGRLSALEHQTFNLRSSLRSCALVCLILGRRGVRRRKSPDRRLALSRRPAQGILHLPRAFKASCYLEGSSPGIIEQRTQISLSLSLSLPPSLSVSLSPPAPSPSPSLSLYLSRSISPPLSPPPLSLYLYLDMPLAAGRAPGNTPRHRGYTGTARARGSAVT
jgi:hypothetical protein